jgi:flavin reductase (DIM6/NTAB) family NADH-FMN oxidoreductase RutF
MQTIEIGLHTEFVGEILDIKAEEGVIGENGNPDMEKLKPIAYEPGNRRYFRIGDLLAKAHSVGKEI